VNFQNEFEFVKIKHQKKY